MKNKYEQWMRQALRLAEKGAGFAAPNPMVGAVIVREDKIIGKGYHKRFGGPHAEIEALADCRKHGNDPAGATMLVTLEPCCHTGKTPPCTEAIAAAGIARVIVATQDDFAQVDGKGISWLRQHNIEVEVGICQPEARALNAGFFKLHKTGMPRVILKWAQSLDGRLAWPPGHEHRWFTAEPARHHVHRIRARCGAILVGSQTVIDDNPLLTVRLPGSSRHFRPLRVILDGRLRVPLDCNLVTTIEQAGVLIYTSEESLQRYPDKVIALREMDCQVQAIPLIDGQLDLTAVLQDLGQRGVVDLMVEGGARVHAAFLRHRLADRIMAYLAGIIIGGEDTPQLIFDPLSLRLLNIQIETFGEDIMIAGDIPPVQ